MRRGALEKFSTKTVFATELQRIVSGKNGFFLHSLRLFYHAPSFRAAAPLSKINTSDCGKNSLQVYTMYLNGRSTKTHKMRFGGRPFFLRLAWVRRARSPELRGIIPQRPFFGRFFHFPPPLPKRYIVAFWFCSVFCSTAKRRHCWLFGVLLQCYNKIPIKK